MNMFKKVSATLIAGAIALLSPVTAQAIQLPVPVQSEVQKLKTPTLIAPGTRIEIPDSNMACTVGWIAQDTENGDYGFITAGHCGQVGNSVRLPNGTVVGTITKQSYSEALFEPDIAFVKVEDHSLLDFRIAGLDKVATEHINPELVYKAHLDLCKTGQTSGTTCGNFHDKVSDNRIQIRSVSAPGDSGAPVYALKKDGTPLIVGILSGSPDADDSLINVQPFSENSFSYTGIKPLISL